MEALLIKRDFNFGYMPLRKGCIHLTRKIDEFKRLKKQTGSKDFEVIELNDYIKHAKHNNHFQKLLIFRTGGIGDLIALSSVCDYLQDINNNLEVHFFTNPKYFDLFKWFQSKPKVHDIYDPILTNFDKKKTYNNIAQYDSLTITELGNERNWYELFFERIGVTTFDLDYMRPELIRPQIFNETNIKYDKKSLLICNKASAMMRTIEINEILKALPKWVFKEYDIYCYEQLINGSKPNINIIPPTPFNVFLNDLFNADMVISVDTGALHFREGISKPAIGLYGAFSTGSRTLYYEYTKSYDIKSKCDLQPCFLHQNAKTSHCPKSDKEMFSAPCFSSNFNVNLSNQLTAIFEESL